MQRQEVFVKFPAQRGELVAAGGHEFNQARLRRSESRACNTVGEASSQAVRRARDVSGWSRNSHRMRRLQRRPNRSSSAMIGRPDVEPRTLRFFMAEVCFGTESFLALCYR